MLEILRTFLYSTIGSIVVPWLSSKLGLDITSAQTTQLQSLAFGGLIGAGAALSHLVHKNVHPVSAGAPAKAIALPLLAGLLLLGSAAGLTGCSSLSSFLSSPSGTAVVTASVDVAVATAEQKGISAAQINAISKQALAADSGVTATLASISQVANAQIAKLNLPAGDVAAIEVLETAFAAALVAKIGGNTSVANAQAAIAVLLQQVIADTGG